MLTNMDRSRLRQIFAVMLGLFVALGMSASVVQATTMSVKMATAAGMSAAGDGMCDDCNGDGSGMKATGCGAALCTASAIATLPQTVSLAGTDTHERSMSTPPLLVGWTSSPRPHP